MITMVKSESFKTYERAYNACFETSYEQEKREELERIKHNFFKNKPESVKVISGKGFTDESIAMFVNHVRHGTQGIADNSKNFLEAYRYSKGPNDCIVDIINDIDIELIFMAMDDFAYPSDNQKVDIEALKHIVFRVGLMAELRIDAYNLLSMYGSYDEWCQKDFVTVSAYEFLSGLLKYYLERIVTQLLDKSKTSSEIYEIVIRICNGRIDDDFYGFDKKDLQLCFVLYQLTTLIDGRCEWFWNED